MPTNNDVPDGDKQDAFRKFIDESLDLAGLERSRTPPEGAPDLTGYNPALADHEALTRDIRQAWNRLHREKPGQSYWAFRLSPLELETRGVLEEMILARLQKRFTSVPTEGDLRLMIAYTMTLSWLILSVLEEKYAPPKDDSDIEF
jgi:hypothetical protein